jgi:hypothetical protein
MLQREPVSHRDLRMDQNLLPSCELLPFLLLLPSLGWVLCFGVIWEPLG